MKTLHIASVSLRSTPLLFACLLLSTLGCSSSARERLLLAASESINACIDSDNQLQQSLLTQIDVSTAALNAAFLADLEGLTSSEGAVSYEDIVEATTFYNARLADIVESRVNIELLFAERRRLLQDALTMIQMASKSGNGRRILREVLSDSDGGELGDSNKSNTRRNIDD